MAFDPDLINKFQQNLRMAQIHSTGGVDENNIENVITYMREAISNLQDCYPKNEIYEYRYEIKSEILANTSENDDVLYTDDISAVKVEFPKIKK